MGLTYVVVNNDSLSRIASRINVPINDLLAVNGFVRSSVIVPGQVIKLPDTASNAPANQTSAASVASSSVSASATSSSVAGPTYVVQRNDSLSLIASKTKVSLSALLSANKFTRTSVIVPGQVIKLPASASVMNASSVSASSASGSSVSTSANTSTPTASPTDTPTTSTVHAVQRSVIVTRQVRCAASKEDATSN